MSQDPPACPLCRCTETRLLLSETARSYFRCPDCACAFMDPSHRLPRSREHAYYRLHRNDPADERYRSFVAPLAEALTARLVPGDSGLDFGSGDGSALAAMLRERGCLVREYDPLFRPDPAALRGPYRFIACCEVAEHLHQPMSVFRELAGRLAPGGWLGVMTALLDGRVDFRRWHYRRDPTHVVFYSLDSFRWLATELGGWQLEHPAPNVVMLRRPSR